MAKCKHETQSGICEIHSSNSYCHVCDSENLCKGYEPKTNADRIRAMSDEELEAFLIDVDLDRTGSPFITDWWKWLKQPAEIDHARSVRNLHKMD